MPAKQHPLRFYLLASVSVLFCLFLGVIPLTGAAVDFRPEFLCLLIIFLVLIAPQYVGLTLAFLVGLLQDVVEFGVWGAHAFALVLVAYSLISAEQRMRSYSLWQQSLWVAVLVGMHQVVVNWVNGLAGYSSSLTVLLASTSVSALFWPVLRVFGARLIRVMRVL